MTGSIGIVIPAYRPDVEVLTEYVHALDAPDVDLAVGSRRHPDAVIETTQSITRQFLGDGFAWLARRLLDVQLADYQCGAKAVTSDGWQQLHEHLSGPGFAWDVELVAFAGALDLRVREVPITWHDHPNSTVPPVRTSIRLASALVRARHRARRLDGSRLHTAIDNVNDGLAVLLEEDRYLRHNK